MTKMTCFESFVHFSVICVHIQKYPRPCHQHIYYISSYEVGGRNPNTTTQTTQAHSQSTLKTDRVLPIQAEPVFLKAINGSEMWHRGDIPTICLKITSHIALRCVFSI